MDLLIKNIGLPSKGNVLFQISANGDVWVENINDEGTGIILAKAIELPPHGRLVDADELKLKKKHSSIEFCENIVSVFEIDHAPTIVEAST